MRQTEPVQLAGGKPPQRRGTVGGIDVQGRGRSGYQRRQRGRGRQRRYPVQGIFISVLAATQQRDAVDVERLVDFPRDQSRQLLERCRPPRAIGQTGQNLPGVVLFTEIAPVDGEQQRPPYERQTDHQAQRHQPDLGRCLGEDVDQRLLTVTIQVGGQQDDRHAHQREHRVARERVLNGLADDETGLEDPVDDHRVRRDHGHEQNGEGYHERGGPGPTRRREVRRDGATNPLNRMSTRRGTMPSTRPAMKSATRRRSSGSAVRTLAMSSARVGN